MFLKEVFYPASIAVIGASANEQKERASWVGRLQDFGYRGRIYPINPRASRILGYEAYPSIKDVPEVVDYAILAVKGPIVPQALEECAVKGVKVAHIYTAGFKETGKEDGGELQAELEEIISRGNIRVIGPNCMGVYCPASGMTFSTRFSPRAGPVGLVSQSGAALMGFIPQANKRGIQFSKVVSYGNAIDLESGDFLEYMARDAETKLVFCYIEGVKDGRRLLKAIHECIKAKPVVILKGGMSKGGREAVASHTASLAGSKEIWQGFFRQNGIISVDTFDEAVEQIVAWQCIAPPKGRAVGIVARGGGPGIIATDQCEAAGLFVHALTPETRSRLEKMTPAEAGSSVRNPVEIGLGRFGLSEYYEEGLRLVAADPHVDMVLTQINPQLYTQYGIGAKQVDEVANVLIGTAKTLPKPMTVVMPLGDSLDTIEPVLKAHEKCLKAGLAVFTDMGVAVKAISKLIQYYESTHSLPES